MLHNSKNPPPYSLRPVAIEIYPNDTRVRFHPGNIDPPENCEREDITEFSRKSRQRLAFVASNTSIDFLSMITLTYPLLYPGDGREVKKHLNKMLTRLRQRYTDFEYLWFLEFQKRGAPHVHILASPRSDRKSRLWLSQAWYKIVGSSDVKHLKAGTQFVDVRRIDGAKRYAVKYAMKMRQKRVPSQVSNVGRFWGHSKNVKPKQIGESIPITGTDDLRYICQRWDYAHKLDQPFSILYNASVAIVQQLISDRLKSG